MNLAGTNRQSMYNVKQEYREIETQAGIEYRKELTLSALSYSTTNWND